MIAPGRPEPAVALVIAAVLSLGPEDETARRLGCALIRVLGYAEHQSLLGRLPLEAIRARLKDIYEAKKPRKVKDVDKMLRENVGHEVRDNPGPSALPQSPS